MSSTQACLRVVGPAAVAEATLPTLANESLPLRERAILQDEGSSVDVNLALFWRELAHGLCRVVDGFFTAERGYLLLATQPSVRLGIEGRRREILRVLLRTPRPRRRLRAQWRLRRAHCARCARRGG